MDQKQAILAVHNAIRSGNTQEAIRLMESDHALMHMWTPFGTWLHDAARYGRLDIAKLMVRNGLNPDAYNDANETPPLGVAAARGQAEIVRFLIDSGASLDTSDSVRNPLLAVIVGGDSDAHTLVAKLIIDGGIDTTIRYPNLDNMNALEMAREYGRNGIVELLERV